MTPCVCGHCHFEDVPWGVVIQGGCTECTCVIYEPDDGTPTPGSCCSPDHRSDPYEGIYQSNGKYTI